MNPAVYQQAAKIFTEACSLTPGERTRYITKACHDDDELRQAVMQLIEHDERPDALVDTSSFDGGGAAMLAAHLARESESKAAAQMPKRIGGYRIMGVLGRGGFGVVYEAEQEQPRRTVALKVIRHDAVSERMLSRFKLETDLLGRLRHPGIAQIYEAGAHEGPDGAQPFFAMELVTGPPVMAYARQKGLDTPARLELVAAMCDAVHHAHQQGVIHRDLKPDNVLVVPGGTGGRETGQPKILDFGVARATGADVQTVTMQTEAGQLVGTIAYMSPEQAGGDPADIDIRSDVYALGVIMYELLAGRLPYAVTGKMIHEAVRVIREDEPSRLTTVDRAFRGDVETIVGRALEKDKARRYQSAAELAADIRRFLADEPILARPVTTWYQIRKFTRRNRTLVGGVAMTLVVLIAGVIVATALAIRSDANAAEARRESYRAGITAASAVLVDDPGTAARYLDATPSELRGWEWRHLSSRLDPHVRSYRAPDKPAKVLAFASDGERLYATLTDGTVAVWSARDATLVDTIAAATPVTTLAVPVAGPARLALGTADGLIVHDPAGGDRVEVTLDGDPVQRLAWSHQGTRLAFVAGERLLVWEEGHPLRELARSPVRAVTISPDGTRVAAVLRVRGAGGVQVWEVATGQSVVRQVITESPLSLAWSRDGARLIAGTLHRLVLELDAATLETTRWYAGHRASVTAVAGSPTGEWASSSSDGTIRLWRDGVQAAALHVGHATPIAFTPDGTRLAYSADDEIRLWDLSSGAATVLRRHTSYVYLLGFSPDGTRLASASPFAEEAFVWNTRTARSVASIDEPGSVNWLAFTADGLLRLHNDLFDPETGTRRADASPTLKEIHSRAAPATWGRLSPSDVCSGDRTMFALGFHAYGDKLTVIDTAGAVRLAPDGRYWGAAFSPDSQHLAAANHSGNVEIWDLATGELVIELTRHAAYGPAYCVLFHPDGTRLATGGNDGVIRLWDTATWQQVHEMRGHTSYVKALAFSPDGTQLASGSGDFTVRVWDTLSRAERARQSGDQPDH